MIHEKIIKRTDGTRYEIRVSFWINLDKPVYDVSVYRCAPKKRTFISVYSSDDYTWRRLDQKQRQEYRDNLFLQHLTPEEIHAAKLELWEKLKP